MKVLYIETRSKAKPEDYNIDINFIKHLPKDIFLAYSIQFRGQAEAMKKELERNNIKVHGFRQVLGCTKLKSPYTILLMGQGRFHALNLALQNTRPILLYSNGSSIAVGKREVDEYNKRKQGALSLFFSSDNTGIIVSAKPGQENLKRALKLKQKIEKKYPEKQVYIFASSMINTREFENFKIGSWINTACPGLANDNARILNIEDILEFL